MKSLTVFDFDDAQGMWEREDSLATEVGEELHDIMEQLRVLREMLAVCNGFLLWRDYGIFEFACLLGVRVFSFLVSIGY